MTSASSNFNHYLRRTYGENGRKIFRNLEKIEVKLAVLPIRTDFLKKCLQHGLTPPFARRTKKLDPRFEKDVKKFESCIIKSAIRFNYEDLRKLQSERGIVQLAMWKQFSRSDYHSLLRRLNYSVSAARQQSSERLKVKFNWLKNKTKKPILAHSVMARPVHKPKCVKKVIHNLSDRVLSAIETQVLEKGLKFSACTGKVPTLDIKVAVEDFGRKMVLANERKKWAPNAATNPPSLTSTEKIDDAEFRCKPKHYKNAPDNIDALIWNHVLNVLGRMFRLSWDPRSRNVIFLIKKSMR